jgi:hypothetical protein
VPVGRVDVPRRDRPRAGFWMCYAWRGRMTARGSSGRVHCRSGWAPRGLAVGAGARLCVGRDDRCAPQLGEGTWRCCSGRWNAAARAYFINNRTWSPKAIAWCMVSD